jgi:hypothetical protein
MQYQPDSSVLPTEPWNDVYLVSTLRWDSLEYQS